MTLVLNFLKLLIGEKSEISTQERSKWLTDDCVRGEKFNED